MAAMERHLWLKLSAIKEKAFLLEAPVLTSGLFGNAVSAVVDRFQVAKDQLEAFQ